MPIEEIFIRGEFPTSQKLNNTFSQFARAQPLADAQALVATLQTTVNGLIASVASVNDGGALVARVTADEVIVTALEATVTQVQASINAISGVGPLPGQVGALEVRAGVIETAATAETAARVLRDQQLQTDYNAQITAEASARFVRDGQLQADYNALLAGKQNTLGFTPIVNSSTSGNTVLLGWNGANLYAAVDTFQLGKSWNDNDAPQSVNGSGYMRLPNGLVMMWGGGQTTSGNQDTIPFVATFPSFCAGVYVTSTNAVNWVAADTGIPYPRVMGLNSYGRSSFVMTTVVLVPNSSPVFQPAEWFTYMAIGY